MKTYTCALLLLLCHIAWAQTGAGDRISLNVEGVSLRNTLQLLANKLGKNLLIDPEVQDTTLRMSLDEISAEDAFRAILESNDLSFREMDGNILYVGSLSKIGAQMVVRNIPCKYAFAKDLAGILEKMVVSEYGAIMADERTNTLIIKESPGLISKMERLIQQLDKPTRQVYIQAEIMEISSTDNSEFGVEWLWKTANVNSLDGRIGSDFGLRTAPQSTENTTTVQDDGFPFPIGGGLGVGVLNSDVEVVLHALNERNDLNLLSRPRVITLDNQEAIIEVGDQIPFKKLNQFGVTSFEFKDATVQLVVKPHIIDDDHIMMKVSPKADFANGFTPDGTPIISTRKASTNVKIRDGQTIVIGGLIRDSLVDSKSKVPILGDIPLLGYLFKNSKTTKVKTQLIVFVTPIILNDDMQGVFDKDFQLRDNMQKNTN